MHSVDKNVKKKQEITDSVELHVQSKLYELGGCLEILKLVRTMGDRGAGVAWMAGKMYHIRHAFSASSFWTLWRPLAQSFSTFQSWALGQGYIRTLADACVAESRN